MSHADTMPKPRRNVELLLLVLALSSASAPTH
jgi:hypothetical protein